ncbi:hypothetical protein CEXT_753101 [Caerostris extrusa]|uniref:Cytochrome P450 n=1 Tax=Caerostris extrusa TaxID=172846 RepID=A0AAV4VBM7_CAEEX|nr:hypothetical protein CEXT_753101 [Caerostris extrusa]
MGSYLKIPPGRFFLPPYGVRFCPGVEDSFSVRFVLLCFSQIQMGSYLKIPSGRFFLPPYGVIEISDEKTGYSIDILQITPCRTIKG